MIIDFLRQNKAEEKLESRWFHRCSDNNIPYVITRKRTSLGDVEWDGITLNTENDAFLQSQRDLIEHELNTLLKYYIKHNKTVVHIGSLTGYVKNLPVESVDNFATDVCKTLMEAYNRHTKIERMVDNSQ